MMSSNVVLYKSLTSIVRAVGEALFLLLWFYQVCVVQQRGLCWH